VGKVSYGRIPIIGGAAHDDAVSGAPLLQGGRASTAVPSAVSADGDAVYAWFRRTGAQVVALVDPNGVDLLRIDDAAFTVGTHAVMPMGAMADETATDSVDEGDVGIPRMTLDRKLIVAAQGPDAHDAAVVGNPLLVGGRAQGSLPTVVSADGDAARLWVTPVGSVGVTLEGSSSAGSDTQSQSQMISPAGVAHSRPLGAAGHIYNGSNWDRLRSILPFEGTGSSTLTGLLAAGIGPGFDRRLNPGNLGTVIGNTSTFDTNGSSLLLVGINTTTTGTFTIEGTADGTNWIAVEAWDLALDQRVTGTSLTPTVGKVYGVRCAGFRQIRLRTVTTLGASMVHFFTGSLGDWTYPLLGNLPHLGLVGGATPLLTETAQYTTTQTGVALVTPTSGKRLVVVAYQIQVGGTTAGTMQLWFESANADTTYTRGTDHAIFDGEFAPSATLKPGVVQSGLWIGQGVDFDLRVTDSAAINPLTVTVWYYEI
jgi:hypothetical protein